MRKLLMVALVAGFAVSANAATIDIQFSDGTYEKTLQVSEYTDVEVWITLAGGEQFDAENTVYGVTQIPPEPADFTIENYAGPSWMGGEFNVGSVPTDSSDLNGFASGWIDLFAMGYTGPGTFLVESFDIHCSAVSEDIIYLDLADSRFVYAGGAGPLDLVAGASGGELILHQVPEPASFALLALGGLALIRRR